MTNNNIPPFYVGQPVVRIGESTRAFKKGEQYTVLECLRCKCGTWNVVLNIPAKRRTFPCAECDEHIAYTENIGGLASRFAPITEAMQPVTFEKITEDNPVSVN